MQNIGHKASRHTAMLAEGVLIWDSLLTIMSVIARLGMLIGTARSVRNCVLIICEDGKRRERLGRIRNILVPGNKSSAE